jgi:predicted N-acetyltransferase YhbS
MECIMSHPDLQGLRRWSLVTRDAHGLYAKFGFTPIKKPQNYMELHDPEAYTVEHRLSPDDCNGQSQESKPSRTKARTQEPS